MMNRACRHCEQMTDAGSRCGDCQSLRDARPDSRLWRHECGGGYQLMVWAWEWMNGR